MFNLIFINFIIITLTSCCFFYKKNSNNSSSSNNIQDEDIVVSFESFADREKNIKYPEIDQNLKNDFLNLFYYDRFKNNIILLNGKKIAVEKLENQIQNFIWLEKAKIIKNKLNKIMAEKDILSYIKYKTFYTFIDKMSETKTNDLHKEFLFDVDKQILRKLYD